MAFRFDDYALDRERRELARSGAPVAVEPQVLDLLVYLIEHRDRVVGKDELIATVWCGRIVSDSTLASRINAARRAVGDSGEQQRLIRTYPRKGVRFIGEVGGFVDASVLPAERPPNTPDATAAAARGKPCLAVLPFANLSNDADQDYFSDGITEDIITALSRNRALTVIARNSTFAFRGKGSDVRDIGQALGADYVVDGSVRRLGLRVRVTAQLADAESGQQIWAERYDRELQDIFEVQDEITTMVAARLDPEVGIAEQRRAARKPSQALDAWDLFRLGTKTFYRWNAEDNREAQRLFRRAIEADRELAQAYGFLSYSIVLGMVYFDVDPDEALLDEAVAIARRGVVLDDRDALVRFMYGRALIARGAYDEALEELVVALDANPNLAIVHCGLADSLVCAGRVDDAIPYFDSALSLSPHDPLRWSFLAYRSLAHLFAGQFDAAALWSHKATLLPQCHYMAFAHRVAALGHLDQPEDAAAAVRQLLQRRPDFSVALARRRLFYIRDPRQLAVYLGGLVAAGVDEMDVRKP